jgi:hypothetical protein
MKTSRRYSYIPKERALRFLTSPYVLHVLPISLSQTLPLSVICYEEYNRNNVTLPSSGPTNEARKHMRWAHGSYYSLTSVLLPSKLGLLVFNPEDGNNMFLRNIGKVLSDYTASHFRSHPTRERQNRHVHYGILHNIR